MKKKMMLYLGQIGKQKRQMDKKWEQIKQLIKVNMKFIL